MAKISELLSVLASEFHRKSNVKDRIILEEHEYEELKDHFEKKYQAAFDNNPNEVTDEHFGLIAECKYENVTDELKIFKELFSSSRDPAEIR